jgi:hypothetical protein
VTGGDLISMGEGVCLSVVKYNNRVPPPSSPTQLSVSLFVCLLMSRYFRLPDDEASSTPTTSSFNMLASMKDTALWAPPVGAATMIGSVRAGLGLAPPTDGDGGGVDNNSDDTESLASSTSRSVMEEVSEYCPTMTYQQVR